MNFNFIAECIALLAAFIATAIIGFFVLPILKKLKIDQIAKEIGPTWHKVKNGTPTMGGIFLIVGTVFGVFASCFALNYMENVEFFDQKELIRLWAGILCAIGFGLVGFVDDYVKIKKNRNTGISAAQKTIFQFIITITYFTTLVYNNCLTTIVDLPVFGEINFGTFYYIISVLGIYGIVNAVNLTDGLDGLASSVTATYAIVFMIISNFLGIFNMNILASAVCGGCLGFLVWNFHPAKVFMGDTGSMFLGGMVAALGFGLNKPLLILIVGIIYVIEAMSVVLQVISFKLTGKRIFKMSPIHHHFELCKWSEVKIVIAFSMVTAIFGSLAFMHVLS